MIGPYLPPKSFKGLCLDEMDGGGLSARPIRGFVPQHYSDQLCPRTQMLGLCRMFGVNTIRVTCNLHVGCGFAVSDSTGENPHYRSIQFLMDEFFAAGFSYADQRCVAARDDHKERGKRIQRICRQADRP